MKIGTKTRKILAMFLAAMMVLSAALLPACSSETDGPESSSDALVADTPFRSLTDEEAEALFGRTEPCSYVDGDWYYFATGFSNGMTIYRYNYATGEVGFACQKPGCAHNDDLGWHESSCPLYSVVSTDADGKISVMNGKLIYLNPGWTSFVYDEEGNLQYGEDGNLLTEKEDNTLVWYDSQTQEIRSYPVAAPLDWCRVCYRVEDSFYYENWVNAFGEGDYYPELWRLDEAGGEPRLAAMGEEGDYRIIPYLFNNEEIFLAFSEIPEGDPDWPNMMIYRVENASVGETGERSLFYEKSVSGSDIKICGQYMLYRDYDVLWWQNFEKGEEYPPAPETLYLVDLSTGEEKVLEEETSNIYGTALTDRCVLYLQDDPEGEYAYILHCYNYLTGEKTDYPLKGDKWESHGFYYDRGQVYLVHPGFDDGSMFGAQRDLVVWDIASGALREIKDGKIVKEVK